MAGIALTTGATAANLVLTLLITSIGRDVLTLIGLFAVMVIQDPVMSLAGLIIAPPAMIVLRKLVRRVRVIAKTAFTGGTQTIETVQETLQGMRVVKAFTLEDEMRRRLDENVAAVERDSYKMARVANRASPLMETLGGLAICLAIIWSSALLNIIGIVPVGRQLQRRRPLQQRSRLSAGVRGRRGQRHLGQGGGGSRHRGPQPGRVRRDRLGVVRVGGQLRRQR